MKLSAFPEQELTIGPVRCAWRPLERGTRAETAARDWLATALRSTAETLPLVRSPQGRPRLGRPLQRTDINWSHSGDGLLMALGDDIRIGVDLELRRPRPRALELAWRFFAPEEAALIAAFATGEQERAFTRLWCAKEAVLKAHGKGLAFGLDRLRFHAGADGNEWSMVECDPALGEASDWSLHHFEPAPGYFAALAWRPCRSGLSPRALS